jgi:succinate dehydrogenase / fumarate reductase cytochrome b subunit
MTDQVTGNRPRPLSPHLSIYKPQISSVLSIMHRATGVGLAAGALILGLWIWGAAYDVTLFGYVTTLMNHWVGQLFLGAWTLALFYHMFNGIRHLFWDVGMGFELPVMARSGWSVLFLAAAMTAIIWFPHVVKG